MRVERDRQLTEHERLPEGHLAAPLVCAGRMLDQELDEGLPALPAIDAATQIRIERDRAVDEQRRDARVPEPARVHQRAIDLALLRFVERGAKRRLVTERGKDGQRPRQRVLSREQVQHSRGARADHVLPRLALDRRARVDQDLGRDRAVVGTLALRVRAVDRVRRGAVEQRLPACAAPRDQRGVSASSVRSRSSSRSWIAATACEAAHSSARPRRLCTSAVRSVQPANPYSRAMTSCASRFESGSGADGNCAWTRATASPFPAAASRASFFACLRRESSDGRAGRSRTADMAPPFTNRLRPLRNQAERRCKTPPFQTRTGGSASLAAGGWRPVRRAGGKYRSHGRACQRTCRCHRIRPDSS